jgi:hypothetical protein
MLKRIHVFTRFLEDGRICLSNNAAERELRGIARLPHFCTTFGKRRCKSAPPVGAILHHLSGSNWGRRCKSAPSFLGAKLGQLDITPLMAQF